MSNWECLKCSYNKGGFQTIGYGYIMCPVCNTRHFVQNDGKLIIMEYPKDHLQAIEIERRAGN